MPKHFKKVLILAFVFLAVNFKATAAEFRPKASFTKICLQKNKSKTQKEFFRQLKLSLDKKQCYELFETLKNAFSLKLESNKKMDLSLLRYFKHLQILDLEGAKSFIHLDQIAFLSQLAELNLNQTGIQSLKGIKHFPHLRVLHLKGTQIRDLSPLRLAKNLRFLDISYSHVQNLSMLPVLLQLKQINLKGTAASRNQIEHLSHILPNTYILVDPLL